MWHKGRVMWTAFLLALAAATGLLLGLDALSATGDAGPHPSSPLRRLTGDGDSTPLAWTADGQTLLVKRPGRVVADGQQQLFELWAISVGDGHERRLSENAFSPAVDGSRVAYLRFVGRGRWEAVEDDLGGSGARSLGAAHWNMPPTWVGDRVLYLRPSGQLASPDGMGVPFAPVPLPSLPERARLSDDGRYLAISDGRQLRVVSVQGPVMAAQADQVWGFAWSGAEAQLAYVLSNDGPDPELWVWDAESGGAWMLVRGEMEHFDTPVWSPDGRTLAFARRPTGSGPNAAGDIWLARGDSAHSAGGFDLRPLALTPGDEHSPCWSPDGQVLAFAMDGDVWLADLRAPDLAAALAEASREPLGNRETTMDLAPAGRAMPDPQVYGSSLTPLVTIRVKHDAAKNNCRNVPDGQIDIYEFEEYVKRVVPQEVYPSWPAETLKAQAVAARTYAWRKSLDRSAAGLDYDVWDSTSDQHMCDVTQPSTDAAVEATRGQYISYAGKVIYAFYCAETGNPTNYRQELNLEGAPYLRPVYDPVSFGQTRRGHSWGMSQWGAYRWVAWHGWEYQQILCHYYTSAAVEHSGAFTQPLGSLTLPWTDSYVHTNFAYLRANATGDGGTLTVTFAARITDTWTVLHVDADGSDGWEHVWPVADEADTYTPSVRLRITISDSAGHAIESSISHLGLHRTPPSGTLGISATEVTTLAVSVDVTTTDSAPVSGAIQVSLGNDNWVWEEGDLEHSGGGIVSDSSAGNGGAWHVSGGTTGTLTGTCASVLPVGGQYRAYLRLKVPTAALTSALELARLDVTTEGGQVLLGLRTIRGTDFKAGDVYQDMALDFEVLESSGEVEFRVESGGGFDLYVDRVRIVSYPVEVNPSMDWTLPAREGVVTVTAKFVDRAGNVSGDVMLPITITDDSAPGEWQQFQWHGVTCTVHVRDAIAGLDVSSAAYQYSIDGGVTWSGWLSASCTGADGTHDWETITTGFVPFLDAPVAPLIRFRVSDVSTAANEGQSPTYAIRRVYMPMVVKDE